eukprot:jgi/Mesvir1/18847/Mv03447-RA.1
MNRQVRWTGGGKAFLLNYPESRRQVLVVGGRAATGSRGLTRAPTRRWGYLASARSLCEHLLTHPSMVKRGGGWHMDITGGGNGGAVGVIAGSLLTRRQTDVGEVVTFSQPAVTDAAGADTLRGTLSLTRVVPSKGEEEEGHFGDRVTVRARGCPRCAGDCMAWYVSALANNITHGSSDTSGDGGRHDSEQHDSETKDTTRPHPQVARALGATAATLYGNASSSHKAGRESHDVVEDSRRTLARHLGVRPGDVIFTGGATESNNIIIHSVLERARGRGVVLTTKVEHPSVLQPLLHVRKASRGGVKVVQLPVDREGFVRMDSLREAVKKWGGRIKLVSVIYANNEIGTVQDMGAIRRAVGKGVHIHADTTQVAGKAPLGKDQRFMDSFTVSGHKIHGVKGVGALVVRAGADSVVPLMHGGGQERGVRPGTESPPLIASLAQAASINMSRAGRARWRRTAEYAARLREGLGGLGASFNGPADPGRRMANLVSFALPGTDGRAMVEWLSRCGICANVGSACSKMKRSRVLRAVGVPEETARGTVRLGLSAYTTQQDVDYLLSCLRRFQKT